VVVAAAAAVVAVAVAAAAEEGRSPYTSPRPMRYRHCHLPDL